MGADIYLRSVNDKAKAEWQPKFDAAVKARDAGAGSQEAVTEAYEGLFGEGYFRDSYNSTSLFWMLGLSWCQLEGYDDEGRLPVPAMQRLLETLREREVTDERMQDWVAKAREDRATIDDGENSVEKWREDFVARRLELIALLEQAIALNEPLVCSV